jgi:hypothetical protein
LNRVLQVAGIMCAFAAGSALSVLVALLAWIAGLLSIVVNGIVARLCRIVVCGCLAVLLEVNLWDLRMSTNPVMFRL